MLSRLVQAHFEQALDVHMPDLITRKIWRPEQESPSLNTFVFHPGEVVVGKSLFHICYVGLLARFETVPLFREI